MSKRETGLQLLKLLNRQFKAKITGKQLAEIFVSENSEAVNFLWKKGILSVAGPPDKVDCPFGEHDDEAMILADKRADGRYWGYCPEHRKEISVPAAECELIEFNPAKWFETVRSMNGIEGDHSINSSGHCFVGVFKTEKLKMGVSVISANAIGDSRMLRTAGAQPRFNLWIHLDDRIPKGSIGDGFSLLGKDIFTESSVKFDKQAIAKALASLSVIQGSDNQVGYEKHSHLSKSSIGLTIAQYQAEVQLKKIKGLDLFIDLANHRAWIKGKEIKHMKTKNEKGKFKPLSKTGLELLASFIRVPSTRHAPIQMGPYAGKDDGRDADSAAKMMANIRSALSLQGVIKTHSGRGGIRGDSLYSFEPGDKFTYALITSTAS